MSEPRPWHIEDRRDGFPIDVAKAIKHLRSDEHRYGDHRVVSANAVDRVLSFFADTHIDGTTAYDRWDWSK